MSQDEERKGTEMMPMSKQIIEQAIEASLPLTDAQKAIVQQELQEAAGGTSTAKYPFDKEPVKTTVVEETLKEEAEPPSKIVVVPEMRTRKEKREEKLRVRHGGVTHGGTSMPSSTPSGAQPDQLLVEILCRPRRHDSVCEQAFKAALRGLAIVKDLPIKELALGSWAWEVGTGPAMEEVMFSCHIDTQDEWGSCNQATNRKKLVYDPNMEVIMLDTKHKIGSCLGADDGAGVWIMLKMIEARVPGTYVFHRGEEVGGLSAKGNVKDHADYFKKRKMAIAFDRAGSGDVITTQGGTLCASQKFAEAVAAAFNDDPYGFDYKPCSNGVYTDTKDYRGLIGECINLSVGYQNQHGPSEFQDWSHLKAMAKRCCLIKWHQLPCSREPYIAPAPTYPQYGSGHYQGSMGRSKELQDDFFGGKTKDTGGGGKAGSDTKKKPVVGDYSDLDKVSYTTVYMLCHDVPDEAADLIVELLRERARLKADIAILEGVYQDLK